MKAGEQNKGQLLRRTATPAGPTILRTSTCNIIVIDRGFFIMKITRNQLRCLIKEELLSECAGDNSRLADIMNPMFNVREICKQLTLLEDHLNRPEMRCTDCINKHLMKCEALAEEAVSLDDESQYPFLKELPDMMRGWQQRTKTDEDPCRIAGSIRLIRKKLTSVCH